MRARLLSAWWNSERPTGDAGRRTRLCAWCRASGALALGELWTYARRMRQLRVRWARRRLPGWLRRLAEVGASPSDSEELRVRKAVLVLSSTLMASLAFVWVATYAALGLWVSAAIPFAYQVASAASICMFARTRR